MRKCKLYGISIRLSQDIEGVAQPGLSDICSFSKTPPVGKFRSNIRAVTRQIALWSTAIEAAGSKYSIARHGDDKRLRWIEYLDRKTMSFDVILPRSWVVAKENCDIWTSANSNRFIADYSANLSLRVVKT